LFADHFRVAPAAKRHGASALLTIGFMPVRTAGLPVAMHVFSLQHLAPGGGWHMAYRRWAVARGWRKAALVVANSQWTAHRLALAYPTHRRAGVVVSYEGLDHDRFRPDGPRGRADLPGEYVLWSSNFYPYKRAELAIAAYARLPQTTRARFPLVLTGSDWHGGRAVAEAAVAQHNVAADVRVLGWVDDCELPALYRGARALVLSTAEETFGRCVTEAMACGCPCVLEDLPVLREIAQSAAVFTEFTDPAVAGAALESICTDDTRWTELRSAGLIRAKAFGFARLAEERVDAILQALGGAR
jgi:glycosyltransferase involved in cell wall biosynthesis